MVKLRKNNWIGGKSNGAVRDIAPARANFTARNWHLLRKQGGKSSAPAKAVAFAPQTRRITDEQKRSTGNQRKSVCSL